MESKFAQWEKSVWEWFGRFAAFFIGLVMLLLPEKLPNASFGQKIAYEPIGVALCLLTMLFMVVRIIRACNWMEERKNTSIQYVGYSPKIGLG